jgi:hypothetical protein
VHPEPVDVEVVGLEREIRQPLEVGVGRAEERDIGHSR